MSKQYRHNINTDISITYVIANKKSTAVAALGVTIGTAIFIFMNSMGSGFVKKSNEAIFNSSPHIRIYKEDEISKPLVNTDDNSLAIISNPMVLPKSDRIVNVQKITEMLKAHPEVTIVTPEIILKVFYKSGISQIPGDASGVNIIEAGSMFNIKNSMVQGTMEDLENQPNGILLGTGLASKMNVKTGDNITVTSSKNRTKIMKVSGLFKTRNSIVDKTKSYISLQAAQQLSGESSDYAASIDVNINDFNKASDYSEEFSALTGYKAEDWKAANSDQLSGFKMRSIIIFAMSLSILIVAGFGTYTILNMTISQRINDIAILKALGFRGPDVIRIFVLQGTLIGLMGLAAGLILASFLVYLASNIYMGPDEGYFPIIFDFSVFLNGILFGLIISFLASYLPARKAANVDPVSIFRK
ncbi:ABC transporter permease [Flavobacterium procerum]|uniref:ABC transporter permease n=1 Tax=Flavobacterium procerum TaxID=1455569 RepID=A0ABV6BUW6_9FLAO